MYIEIFSSVIKYRQSAVAHNSPRGHCAVIAAGGVIGVWRSSISSGFLS